MDDPRPVPIRPGPLERLALALRERLILAFPEKQFDHQWMPARPSKSQWVTLLRRPPFVGISWTAMAPQSQAGARSFAADVAFTVVLVTANESGAGPRLFGDRLAPGLMTMVQVAAVFLHGHTFPDLGSAKVNQADHATAEEWDNENLAMAAIDVTIKLGLGMNEVAGNIDVDALSTLAIEWAFNGTTLHDETPVGTHT